jgi:hypothetical protein
MSTLSARAAQQILGGDCPIHVRLAAPLAFKSPQKKLVQITCSGADRDYCLPGVAEKHHHVGAGEQHHRAI